METNETAQYIRHASKPVSGFLYERTFDLSQKDFSLIQLLSINGYTGVSVEIQTQDAVGSTITLEVEQGNSNDPNNHVAVTSIAGVGANAFGSDHDNTCKAAWLSYKLSGTVGNQGKVTIRIAISY